MKRKGAISNTGYKSNSKDRFNDFNLIPSNRITMKGVDNSLLMIPMGDRGVGNPVMGTPGEEYFFPNYDMVMEMRLPKGASHMNYQRLQNGGSSYLPNWVQWTNRPDFMQPSDPRIPIGYENYVTTIPSNEIAISIGGENGEPAYLIPSFKYGKPLRDPVDEFRRTRDHLGGPFKTVQDAERFGELRHQYLEKGQDVPYPLLNFEYKRGGQKKGSKKFTNKNIQSSVNRLMRRNETLYGPSGKKYFDPLAKFQKAGQNPYPSIPFVNDYYEGDIPEVTLPDQVITAEAPYFAKQRDKYYQQYPKEWYFDKKLPKFSRNVGVDRSGKNWSSQTNAEYDKFIMDKVAEDLLNRGKNRKQTPEGRLAWYNSYTPKEREIIQQSSLASRFNPAVRQYNIDQSNRAQNDGYYGLTALTDADKMKQAVAGTAEKFRMFPESNIGEEYWNPLMWIGQMAQGLGEVPKDIQEGNYGKAALSVATPLTAGALAGLGSPTATQFAKNLFLPLGGLETDLAGNVGRYLTDKGKRLTSIPAIKGVDLTAPLESDVKFRKALYQDRDYSTGAYDIYELNLPDRFVPGRPYEEVKPKMKYLRRDMKIEPLQHYLDKIFGNVGPNLKVGKGGKDRGLFFDPETGKLFDSNTRYWLNREYGHTPDIKPYINEYSNYIAKNYGRKVGTSNESIFDEYARLKYIDDPENFLKSLDQSKGYKPIDVNPDLSSEARTLAEPRTQIGSSLPLNDFEKEVEKAAIQYYKEATSAENFARAAKLDAEEGTNYVQRLKDFQDQYNLRGMFKDERLPFNIEIQPSTGTGKGAFSTFTEEGKEKIKAGLPTSVRDRKVVIYDDSPIDDIYRRISHELKHHYTLGEGLRFYDNPYFTKVEESLLDPKAISESLINREYADELIRPAFKDNPNVSLYEYFASPVETDPYLSTNFRDALLKQGFIKNRFDEIKPSTLINYEMSAKKLGPAGKFYFTAMDYDKMADYLNRGVYGIAPYLGAGYLGYEGLKNTQSQTSPQSGMQYGGFMTKKQLSKAQRGMSNNPPIGDNVVWDDSRGQFVDLDIIGSQRREAAARKEAVNNFYRNIGETKKSFAKKYGTYQNWKDQNMPLDMLRARAVPMMYGGDYRTNNYIEETPNIDKRQHGGMASYTQPTEEQFFTFGYLPNSPVGFYNMGGSYSPMDMYYANGGTVSEIWEETTGSPWSEAKRLGYTDGSYEANIALRERLLSGELGGGESASTSSSGQKKSTSKSSTSKKTKAPSRYSSQAEYERHLLDPYSAEKRAAQLDWLSNKYYGRSLQAPTPTKAAPKKVSKPNVITDITPIAPIQNRESLVDKDPRRIPTSGVVVDKRTNQAYYYGDQGQRGTFPVLTGKNVDLNESDYPIEYLESHPELRATPRGYYRMEPADIDEANIMERFLPGQEPGSYYNYLMNAYAGKMKDLIPIPAYGMPAPLAPNIALHRSYSDNAYNPYDPEFLRRESLYSSNDPNVRCTSFGCINVQDASYDQIYQTFPTADTLMVLDSNNPLDARLLDIAKKRLQEKGSTSNAPWLAWANYRYGGGLPGGANELPCLECGGSMQDGGATQYGGQFEDDMIYDYKKGGWIQKVTKSIKRRGTEGVCTGDKFGGPSCPPGSKRYNLAKTFRAMAKKQYGGMMDTSDQDDYISQYSAIFQNRLKQNALNNMSDEAAEELTPYAQYGFQMPYYYDQSFNPNNFGQQKLYTDRINKLKKQGNQALESLYDATYDLRANADPYVKSIQIKTGDDVDQKFWNKMPREPRTPKWAMKNSSDPYQRYMSYVQQLMNPKNYAYGGSEYGYDLPIAQNGVEGTGTTATEKSAAAINNAAAANTGTTTTNTGTNTGTNTTSANTTTTTTTDTNTTQLTPEQLKEVYDFMSEYKKSIEDREKKIAGSNIFPMNYGRTRGAGFVPTIAYNPANTYLEDFYYQGRTFGQGPRRMRMKFRTYFDPKTGETKQVPVTDQKADETPATVSGMPSVVPEGYLEMLTNSSIRPKDESTATYNTQQETSTKPAVAEPKKEEVAKTQTTTETSAKSVAEKEAEQKKKEAEEKKKTEEEKPEKPSLNLETKEVAPNLVTNLPMNFYAQPSMMAAPTYPPSGGYINSIPDYARLASSPVSGSAIPIRMSSPSSFEAGLNNQQRRNLFGLSDQQNREIPYGFESGGSLKKFYPGGFNDGTYGALGYLNAKSLTDPMYAEQFIGEDELTNPLGLNKDGRGKQTPKNYEDWETDTKYGRGYQNEDLANWMISGVDTVSALLRQKEMRDLEQGFRRNTLADNVFMSASPANRIGSRGRYVQTGMGSGMMDPQNMTPIYQPGANYNFSNPYVAYGGSYAYGGAYQEGGEYELSQDEIDYIMANGGSITYID